MAAAAAAKTPGELRAATEKLRQAQQAKPPTPKVSAEEAAEAGNTPAATAPKAEAPVTAQPTATEETPVEVPATVETTEEATATPATEETPEARTEDDDEDDSSVTPSTAKKLRLQLPEKDEVGRLAVSYLKRNRDWTLEQATAAAKEHLGLNKPEAQATTKPKSDLPETVEATNQTITELRALKKQAAQELRTEDVATLDDKILDLTQHRSDLQRQAERDQVKQATVYDQQFVASEARAVELFEFAGKPESPGGKRMVEIEEALRETDDPRYYAANKPLLIAQMVAAEMNIPPRSKKVVAPAKPAAPAPAPAAKKGILPGGDSRSTPIVKPQVSEAESRISKISSMQELQAEMKRLGLPT